MAVLALLLTVCACGEDAPTASNDATFSITVSSETERIWGIGGTVALTAKALNPSGGLVQDAAFVWTSSDPSVATVDDTGLVTAVAAGTVTISAALEGSTGAISIEVFRQGEFSYQSRAEDGITLSALLRLPNTPGPYPAIVTVHGSEQARKENYSPQALIDAGFAVLIEESSKHRTKRREAVAIQQRAWKPRRLQMRLE